jgi:tRNA uridine 5-carboxymethylaminomethyl modification enzyme
MKSLEGQALPVKINYMQVSGLSQEVKERLAEVLPETLGQASRIQGVTPAAIAVLSVYLKRWKSTLKN